MCTERSLLLECIETSWDIFWTLRAIEGTGIHGYQFIYKYLKHMG